MVFSKLRTALNCLVCSWSNWLQTRKCILPDWTCTWDAQKTTLMINVAVAPIPAGYLPISPSLKVQTGSWSLQTDVICYACQHLKTSKQDKTTLLVDASQCMSLANDLTHHRKSPLQQGLSRVPAPSPHAGLGFAPKSAKPRPNTLWTKGFPASHNWKGEGIAPRPVQSLNNFLR